ncbi:MAG: hypothetical protein GX856_08820 [Gammaproteobacteria bacterium]|nr:hypothetical protein [Gammaproteobacteria bacterium]
MKQWISFLGDAHIAPYPPDGSGYPVPAFARKLDDRLEGAWPEGSPVGYGTLATLNGRLEALRQYSGYVVHGLRFSVRLYASRTSASAALLRRGANGPWVLTPPPGLQEGSLGVRDVSVRALFDVPGDAETPGGLSVYFMQDLTPRFEWGPGGYAMWKDVPAGWTWETIASEPRAYLLGYRPRNYPPGPANPTDGYATGTFSDEVLFGAPIGLVRRDGDELDLNLYGGLVAAANLTAVDTSAYLKVTAFELLVSEKPTWSLTVPPALTVGADTQDSLEFTARYPVGDEPYAGLRVRLRDDTGCVEFLTPAGLWANEAVHVTSGAGQFTCRVRPLRAGLANIVATVVPPPPPDDANWADPTYFFSPPLRGTHLVQVFPQPEAPPNDAPDPPSDGRVCVTVPEIPGSPAIPPRVVVENVTGWDGGAVSVVVVDGPPAALEFSGVKASVGAAIGFTYDDEVTAPSQIEAGFYFSKNRYGHAQVSLVEHGVGYGAPELYSEEDVFRLVSTETAVYYYVNGVRVRKARIAMEGAFRVGGALYSSGDTLPSSGSGGPPPVPGDAVTSFAFDGDVPPDAASGTYLLAPGGWTFSETAPGASCDWVLASPDWVRDVSGQLYVESTEGSIDSYTFAEPTAVRVFVEAYLSGGPFAVEGVLDGGGGGGGDDDL